MMGILALWVLDEVNQENDRCVEMSGARPFTDCT